LGHANHHKVIRSLGVLDLPQGQNQKDFEFQSVLVAPLTGITKSSGSRNPIRATANPIQATMQTDIFRIFIIIYFQGLTHDMVSETAAHRI
jgi:hypothetical protein